MTTTYPSMIDSNVTLPPAIFATSELNAQLIENIRQAVLAIETELGINPKGIYSDTRIRLDILESRINTITGGSLLIDLNTQVTGILPVANGGTGISAIGSNGTILTSDGTSASWQLLDIESQITGTLPIANGGTGISTVGSNGTVLTSDGTNYSWQPAFSAAGDLSGTTSNQTVIGIQTIPVSTNSPDTNNSFLYDGSNWTPSQLTLDPEIVGPAFSITLSGNSGVSGTPSLFEVGQSGTPTFTSTKNYQVTSATLYEGYAYGTITYSGAVIVDGDNFILNDNINPAVTFEFDNNNSVVETSTLRKIEITGAETIAQIVKLIILAINSAPLLDITAYSIGTTGTAELIHDTANTSITATNNASGSGITIPSTTSGQSNNETSVVTSSINSNTSFSAVNSYIRTSYGQTYTFFLKANKGGLIRRSLFTFTWTKKVFWGSSAVGTYDEAFVEGLANSSLATSRARDVSLTVSSGQYFYYAYRAAYGAASFLDLGTNLGFDMTLISTTISVDNGLGSIENYTLYRSTNSSLGAISVRVS